MAHFHEHWQCEKLSIPNSLGPEDTLISDDMPRSGPLKVRRIKRIRGQGELFQYGTYKECMCFFNFHHAVFPKLDFPVPEVGWEGKEENQGQLKLDSVWIGARNRDAFFSPQLSHLLQARNLTEVTTRQDFE